MESIYIQTTVRGIRSIELSLLIRWMLGTDFKFLGHLGFDSYDNFSLGLLDRKSAEDHDCVG